MGRGKSAESLAVSLQTLTTPGSTGDPPIKVAMNEGARYIKIVEWSDEDQCFVGQCPGIIGPCCHGTDEAQVYAELCQIVDEWIENLKKDGKPLPPPTAGRDLAKKLSDAA